FRGGHAAGCGADGGGAAGGGRLRGGRVVGGRAVKCDRRAAICSLRYIFRSSCYTVHFPNPHSDGVADEAGQPAAEATHFLEFHRALLAPPPSRRAGMGRMRYKSAMSSGKPHIEVIARGVIRRGRFVLACRNVKKGYVYLPGGHVEFGETAAG